MPRPAPAIATEARQGGDCLQAPFTRARAEGIAQVPLLSAIDSILAIETPAMRWLREIGPVAKRLNRESKFDLPATPSTKGE